jgi:hypothetical protein
MSSFNSDGKINNIAFTGEAGHGKSTAAQYLTQNKNYVELMFAKKLKDMIIDLFGIDEKYVYDPNFKNEIIPELNTTGRKLCQVIGTELFRNALMKEIPELKLKGETVWIHNIAKQMEKLPKNQKIVISDCRFEDEYDFLKQKRFDMIRVRNPNLKNDDKNKINGIKHESELGCSYDGTLLNNRTKEDMYEKLDNILK